MLNSIDVSGMWISNSATHVTGVCGLHMRARIIYNVYYGSIKNSTGTFQKKKYCVILALTSLCYS